MRMWSSSIRPKENVQEHDYIHVRTNAPAPFVKPSARLLKGLLLRLMPRCEERCTYHVKHNVVGVAVGHQASQLYNIRYLPSFS